MATEFLKGGNAKVEKGGVGVAEGEGGLVEGEGVFDGGSQGGGVGEVEHQGGHDGVGAGDKLAAFVELVA